MVLQRRLDLPSDRTQSRMRHLTTFIFALAVVVWPQAEAVPAQAAGESIEMAQQIAPSEPLVIVVNRLNPVENLSFADLHAIFLGSRNYWSNGRRITLVMREPGEPERKVILHDVCGMNEDQFKIHFLRGLYTGEILVTPKTLVTPLGVRKFIFNVPGAIGYLRQSDVDETVKVVRIDELQPGDKGYKLHVQY
jgi:ABC-type phosphate transport system substrate-binding protein